MPQIDLIQPVFYGPNDPIHWEVDNLPLAAILDRQNLINLALDNVIQDIRDAIGTQGSVSNRLNQSMNADGSLKLAAVDAVLHTIDDHTDTAAYVRMTKHQSDKLNLVEDGANNLSVRVYLDANNFISLASGSINLKASSTVVPVLDAPNNVRFDMAFPPSAAHQHYYGLTPAAANLLDPDYVNYRSTSTATPFVAGSLRVYVNGVRIFDDAEVYVPGALVTDMWTLLSFTEDAAHGAFDLSAAITAEDMIRIDFDVALA